jgi:Ca-activated chloride channel family protein
MIGLAGDNTAIGDAIGLAVKRLENQEMDSRVLILMTDGANTAGEISPIKAAELAADNQLKIYTIGIGADEMIVRSLFGTHKVNPSRDLDEKTLLDIAQKTGGRYFRARNASELNNIYMLLDKLEPVKKDSQYFRPRRELFYWPLALALGLTGLISLSRLKWS